MYIIHIGKSIMNINRVLPRLENAVVPHLSPETMWYGVTIVPKCTCAIKHAVRHILLFHAWIWKSAAELGGLNKTTASGKESLG